MEKTITTRDFADIKRMAQIVNPKVSRKATLLKKKQEIDNEIAELNQAIYLLEAGIKRKFFGLGTEQLVKKVVSPAVKEDGTPYIDVKTGKQLTKTTWEPLECLVYNAEKNNYTLIVEDELEESTITVLESPSTAGSDFDLDSEQVSVQETEDDNNPFNM